MGRARELRELGEGVERLGRGIGSVYLVTGEAGVGKSRLLEELLSRCRTEAIPVARVQAQEVESLPYGVWVPVLRRALGEGLDPSLVPFRSLLSLLLPKLEIAPAGPEKGENREFPPGHAQAAAVPPSAASATPAQDALANASDPLQRYRLFEGMVRLLRVGAKARGLAVALEDLHWADSASLKFLHYLARQLAEPHGSPRLLLVATCRDDEAGSQEDLKGVLQSMDRAGQLRRLPLEPLREAEVEQMVRSMLGPGVVEPDTLQRLYEETDGNALFVGEILKAFLAEGRICLEGGLWRLEPAALPARSAGGSRVPITVRQAVERRLRGLAEPELQAARLGALLGRTFRFEVLSRAAEEPPELLLDQLEALLARRIVTEGAGPFRGSFTFYHHQIREILLESISGAEKTRLHGRVARALEATSDPVEVAADLAFHYESSGEPLRAAHFLEQAAEASDRAWAYERSARLYRAALQLHQVGGDDPRADLEEKAADALFRCDRAKEALGGYTWLLEGASKPVDQARLLRKLAGCWEKMGDYEQSHRCVRQGLQALGARPSGGGLAGALAVAGGLARLAVPRLASDPYRRDEELAREVSSLCDQLVHVQFFLRPPGWLHETLEAGARQLLAARAFRGDDRAARGCLLLGYLLTAGPLSTRRRGLRKLAEAAAEARLLVPSPARASVLREAGYLMHLAGHPGPGLELAREALALSDKLGDVHGLSQNHAILSSISVHLGRLGEAVAEARKAAEMAELTSNRMDEVLSRLNLAYAEALRGRPGEARRALEAWQGLGGARGSPWIAVLLAQARGWVDLLEGRVEEALATSRATGEDCSRLGTARYFRLLLRSQEAEALLACATASSKGRDHHLAELRRTVSRLRSEGRGYALFEGRAAAAEGRALALTGNPDSARRRLTRALRSFEALDSHSEIASTHQTLAALLAISDPAASRKHLEQAREANLQAGYWAEV